MVKRVDNAVYQIVSDVVNKKFKGGFHTYGLEVDGVAYSMDSFNQQLIRPDVLQQAEQAKQKIIDGEIKVTDAMSN
jgi:basic membrane protein A and related proteins